jgi:hypothetical protein
MKGGLNLSLAVANVDISNDKLLELTDTGVLHQRWAIGIGYAWPRYQNDADPARTIYSGVES